jgi:tRNA 5-methylaminomethyl-2-thiouridine biosynthesis bifunctional protein
MSWGPLQPARIDFSDAAAPYATDYGDVYHARAGALPQSRHVFLGGNGLPGRWSGRGRFVILETGFGLGNNFLATWQAWRDDAQRCDQLWYVAIEKHPPVAADMARAHAASALPALADQLVKQWPLLTPDLHRVDFEGGRVHLLLALGDIAQVLPELIAQVDAFYLDGFAPERNPAMWDPWRLRNLPRLAAPGATVATWSVAAAVRNGLSAAGFVVEKVPGLAPKREMTVGRFAPRFVPPAPPGRQALDGVRSVAVVGAGLAGAAAARALAAQGLQVTVVDQHAHCAAETSGNAGGLFHGIVHGHDGTHARWLRAAALRCEQVLRPLITQGSLPGQINGLVRGEQAQDESEMAALIQHLALPPGYVQTRTGALPGQGAAWFYPGGGWVSPAALCTHWLATQGISHRYRAKVQALHRSETGWTLQDAAGHTLCHADAVVLCNASDAQRLAGVPWPQRRVRGQTTVLPAGLAQAPALRWPLADTGYALRLTHERILCGATSQPEDEDTALREADHAHNLAALARLTAWQPQLSDTPLEGRTGWRLQTEDRLPLLGPVPQASGQPTGRLDQPRLVPRQPGLYVFTGLGSRGITQAALAGELLAAWLTGAPMAAPASLVDAVDVARWAARAARRSD